MMALGLLVVTLAAVSEIYAPITWGWAVANVTGHKPGEGLVPSLRKCETGEPPTPAEASPWECGSGVIRLHINSLEEHATIPSL